MKKYMHSHLDVQPFWQRLPVVTTNSRINIRTRQRHRRYHARP